MGKKEVSDLIYRYRRQKRRTNKGTLVLLLLLTAVFLVSCVAGSSPLWIRGVLGVDAANYTTEPAERTLSCEGETAARLGVMVQALANGEVELKPFRNTSQAVKHYRDAILTDLLRQNYSLYVGNSAEIRRTQQAYPNTFFSVVVPQADFENAVFRYFGGTGVHHGNGTVFSYLSRADAYTAPLQEWQREVTLNVLSLEESANTYRMTFVLSDDTGRAHAYSAVFVKRDDGNCYFYSLGNA